MTIRLIGGAQNARIGKRIFINTDICFSVPVDPIVIGKNVATGPSCSFETVNNGHVYAERGRGNFTKPILVEGEVWIGAACIVTQVVTIGKNSVAAAGSAVTKETPSYSVFGGIPAKFIKKDI